MWDLNSPNKDGICAPYLGRQSFNHWTTWRNPFNYFLKLSHSTYYMPTPALNLESSTCGPVSLRNVIDRHVLGFYSRPANQTLRDVNKLYGDCDAHSKVRAPAVHCIKGPARESWPSSPEMNTHEGKDLVCLGHHQSSHS